MKQKLFLMLTAVMLSLLPFAAHATDYTYMKTSKAIGDKITLTITTADGKGVIVGLSGTFKSGEETEYTITNQEIVITGDVTSLLCKRCNLTALSLDHSLSLQELDAYLNQIESLDVSHNARLVKLGVNSNNITSLDVTHNTKLEELDCSWNSLKSIDLTKNTSLTKLSCAKNQISSLNVSNNKNLRTLRFDENPITNIDVTNNPNLIFLSDIDGALTSLDVSKNPKLEMLQVPDNKNLSSLDLSNNPELTDLWINGDNFTELDVSHNTRLISLYCNDNKLTGLDLRKNVSLYELHCYDNQINKNMLGLASTLADRSKNSNLTGLFYCIDLNNPNEGNVVNTAVVRYANARNWNVYDSNKNLYAGSAPSSFTITTTLPVGSDISVLMRTYGGGVTVTGANGTFKEGQKVSYTTTSKTITFTGEIVDFICDNTTLSTLDLRNAPNIESVYCNNDHLESILLGENKYLEVLACYNNSLTSLKLDGATSLNKLSCYGNRIGIRDMDVLIKSLVNRSAMSQSGTLDVFGTDLSKAGNAIDPARIADAKERGWIVKDDNGRTYTDAPYITFYTAKPTLGEVKLHIISNDDVMMVGVNGVYAKDVMKTYTINSPYIYLYGNITLLDCSSDEITEIDVTHAPNLMRLYVSDNSIKTIDVSQNTYLSRFACDDNKLTSLDVSKNSQLEQLWCYDNQINGTAMETLTSSLDDRSSAKRGVFYVIDLNNSNEGNVITKSQVQKVSNKNWDVVDKTSSTYTGSTPIAITMTSALPLGSSITLAITAKGKFIVEGAKLSSKPVANMYDCTLTSHTITIRGDVTDLDCNQCGITKIDVSKDPLLEILGVSRNLLTELDVSANPKLTILDCEQNHLIALDLSKNTVLGELYCYCNNIRGINMTNLVNSLPTKLGKLYCYGPGSPDRSTEYNEFTTENVKMATNKNWTVKTPELTAVDGTKPESHVITMTTSKKVNETVKIYMVAGGTPNIQGLSGTFKSGQWVTYKVTAQNITLTGDITNLKCGSCSLTALDVSKNTALNVLYCHGNSLTSLDLSHNWALSVLYLNDNKLSKLDVSNNEALQMISCDNNLLSLLNLKKNPVLNYLSFMGNKLTTIDVTSNTAIVSMLSARNPLGSLNLKNNALLEALLCGYNNLTSLDLSNNTALQELDCYGNKLKGTQMDDLIASLVDRSAVDLKGKMYAIDLNSSEEGNLITSKQVADAATRGWEVRNANDLGLYPGIVSSSHIIYMTTSKSVNSDIYFTIKATGDVSIVGAKGVYMPGEAVKYTTTSNNIVIAGDVTYLCCSYDGLTSIDVTNNKLLENLYLDNNSLSSLDLSQNTALLKLDCSANPLKSLNVSQNKALTDLYCCKCNLTTLDVRVNLSLSVLDCSDNNLSTLLPAAKLRYLNCSSNNLTQLNVLNNTILKTLVCNNNSLKSLILDRCLELAELDCFGNNIKGTNMRTLVGTLHDRTGKTMGVLRVIDPDDAGEGNVITAEQVKTAKDKNWSVIDVYNNDYVPTGIEEITTDDNANTEVVPVAIYDLAGRRISQMQRGINIVRMSNGTTKKVLVK